MNIQRLVYSIAWAIGAMFFIGVLTGTYLVIAASPPGRIAQTWQDGSPLRAILVLYGFLLVIITGYMWCYRPRMEYILVPFLPGVSLAIMHEYQWPAGLILPTMFCYLIFVIYQANAERDKGPPDSSVSP